MKVLSIGNFGTSWDGSICDEEHIAKSLEDLGHEVHRQPREHWRGDDTPNYPYDFILVAQWDGYPTTLRTGGIPLVYWAFDYQADGQEWHERLVKEADLYLSKRIADSKYPNWQWLSQDFAPQFMDINFNKRQKKDIDILFTGSYLPWATERNKTIEAVREKFNLVIHSFNPWPWQVNSPIMDEGLPELYDRAKIVLSIDHTIEAGYWSDRNAQAICCGAFVLCRYIPLMETRFHNEIEYFYNVEDCLRKIEYWLRPEHDEDRENKGLTAYMEAYKYRVEYRVKDLLTIVRSIL